MERAERYIPELLATIADVYNSGAPCDAELLDIIGELLAINAELLAYVAELFANVAELLAYVAELFANVAELLASVAELHPLMRHGPRASPSTHRASFRHRQRPTWLATGPVYLGSSTARCVEDTGGNAAELLATKPNPCA